MFLKYQLVWYTSSELQTLNLCGHITQCCLAEKRFNPRRSKGGKSVSNVVTVHHYAQRHQGLYAFPKAYAANYMSYDGIDRRVTDGARWPKDLRFTGALKSAKRQDCAVEAVLNELEASPQQGCVLALPCGFGKTVCALAIACVLRRKVFVLVHTTFLAQQWAARCMEFVPGCKVHLWTGTCRLNADRDCHFGIGLMQTIHKLPSNLFANYGVLIIDECHHVPCATLQVCLPKFNARYSLGLSATPMRKDGLTDYLLWAVGPLAYQIAPSYAGVLMRPVWHHNALSPAPPYVSYEDRVQGDDVRNNKLCQIIRRIRMDPKRRLLVLTQRRMHAELLSGMLRDSYLMLGGEEHNLDEAGTHPIIVATYQLVSEGFDMPSLNTIVMAMPKQDLVQCIGRITRGATDVISDDSMRPWLIDFVDASYPPAMAKYRWRQELYRRLKLNIEPNSHW